MPGRSSQLRAEFGRSAACDSYPHGRVAARVAGSLDSAKDRFGIYSETDPSQSCIWMFAAGIVGVRFPRRQILTRGFP